MVLWQGLTEGGTAVPVQVTEAGKVVAEGQQGQEGPPGPPGEQGPQGPQGEYGPGDDVDLGSIKADGSVTAKSQVPNGATFQGYYSGGPTDSLSFVVDGNGNINVGAGGKVNIAADSATACGAQVNSYVNGGSFVSQYTSTANAQAEAFAAFRGSTKNVSILSNGTITAAGNATFAGDKCGFTAAGEVFLTSRGTRYKLVVAGGLVNAEPYTREMELREQAEALKERIEEKRKPRTTDSVPED